MIFDFKRFLEEKRAWYKNVGEVYCPILKEWVVFNSRGFYHLRYDTNGKSRSIAEQIYKLRLLPLVIPVIKNAVSVFDYKKDQYSEKSGEHYEIWELRHNAGKQNPTNVSVVLKRIGNGKIAFFSDYDRKIKTKKPSQ